MTPTEEGKHKIYIFSDEGPENWLEKCTNKSVQPNKTEGVVKYAC